MAAAETFLVTAAAGGITGGVWVWVAMAVTLFVPFRGHAGLSRAAHRGALKRVHVIVLALGCGAVAWAAMFVLFVVLRWLNVVNGMTARPLLSIGLAGTFLLVAYSFTIARCRLKIDQRI